MGQNTPKKVRVPLSKLVTLVDTVGERNILLLNLFSREHSRFSSIFPHDSDGDDGAAAAAADDDDDDDDVEGSDRNDDD